MLMARSYEIILIAKPDFDADAFEKLHERLLKVIEQEGGLELSLSDWGRRRLAYPIDAHRKGNYFYFGFIASPDCILELARQIRLSPEVIRHQTVALSDVQPLAAFDIEKERERVTTLTPDPQDEDERERRPARPGDRGDRGGRGGDRRERRGRDDEYDDSEMML